MIVEAKFIIKYLHLYLESVSDIKGAIRVKRKSLVAWRVMRNWESQEDLFGNFIPHPGAQRRKAGGPASSTAGFLLHHLHQNH